MCTLENNWKVMKVCTLKSSDSTTNSFFLIGALNAVHNFGRDNLSTI